MRKYYQIAFWVVTFIVLTLSFGRSYGGYSQSFYFVTFLFPVILGTSVVFNVFLVPRFLLKKRYLKFFLYSIYAMVFSVYLEILVLTLSLAVLANYQYERLNPKTTDIFWLTMVMYLLVFVNTILLLLQEYFKGQEQNRILRIHRSILVNRDYITAFTYETVSLDGLELPVSRKYKEAALEHLNPR